MQKHSVTSVLSKNHLDHLEANSVSVIPIDSKTSTNNSILNSNSIRQKPSPPRSVFHVQNMKHFQQQLETAAVLMDISKKVIISPPSSPSTSSGSLPATKVNPSRYKTELCRPYQENGTCKYGDKCQFAHGHSELRTVNRHPKYKTDLCRTYHSVGFCPYGPRCHFIHSLDEIATTTTSRNSPVPMTPSSAPSTPTTSATTNEIAAAIAALRQLPIFTPERLTAPPGFGPRPRLALNSSETSGVSSASSLSPSMLTDLEDGQDLLPRLPVFSRFSN